LKIRNISSALALALVVAIPAAAEAADEAKKLEQVDTWFTQYDRNNDGHVTAAEFSMGKSYFGALDTNKDGVLTRAEAKAAVVAANTRPLDWKKLDTDKDGYVTVREWTGSAADFDKLDLDNDRVLSNYDRDLARARRRAEGRLASFDKDGDGFVALSEWPAEKSLFQERDRSPRDGKLSVEELTEDVRRKN